jgi:hypothetical protein
MLRYHWRSFDELRPRADDGKDFRHREDAA